MEIQEIRLNKKEICTTNGELKTFIVQSPPSEKFAIKSY